MLLLGFKHIVLFVGTKATRVLNQGKDIVTKVCCCS